MNTNNKQKGYEMNYDELTIDKSLLTRMKTLDRNLYDFTFKVWSKFSYPLNIFSNGEDDSIEFICIEYRYEEFEEEDMIVIHDISNLLAKKGIGIIRFFLENGSAYWMTKI